MERVLLVDADDKYYLDMSERLLQRGMEVTRAESAREGLVMVRERSPEFVLTEERPCCPTEMGSPCLKRREGWSGRLPLSW